MTFLLSFRMGKCLPNAALEGSLKENVSLTPPTHFNDTLFFNVSASKLPFKLPENGVFQLHRSDGSPHCKPSAHSREVLISRADKRHKHWRQKVGEFLTRLLPGLKVNRYFQYSIEDFPEHYALYSKPRLTGASAKSDDLYLWGSKYVNNFRSPAEFAFHAAWLLTDPTLNQRNCECQWCTGTPQKVLSQRLGVNVDRWYNVPKLRTDFGRADHGVDLRETPPASPTSTIEPPGLSALSELRDHPPYRIGELVWAHVRPPMRADTGETIDCWPGVIVDIAIRPLRTEAGMDRQQALKLKLLGTVHYSTVEALDALPYHAYQIPMNLHQFLGTSRPPNLANDASFDKLSDVKIYRDTAINHEPRQATFDSSWPAFLKGLVMTWRIADLWTLVRTAGGDPATTSHRSKSETTSSTVQPQDTWDTIWWGAESIWVGDLVRLQGKSLEGNPLLPLLSQGAETRTLFFKITKIHTCKPTSISDIWLSGTLYETVPEDETGDDAQNEYAKKEPGHGDDGSSLNDLVPMGSLPEPPLGFRFNPVLGARSTVTIPLRSIAGRYYAHLVFSPVLTFLRSTARVKPSQLLALSGYAPGDSWPEVRPNTHQDRKQLWDELEAEMKRFLMTKPWKPVNGNQAMKIETKGA
ncbi:hypothetical protein DACRYDRAFT_115111 [Dacryopinax primogenitus]|uniref:Cryptic loci regulator 2 N-terminal domain-containing protein n=1 Tax=Dacryopinax primogenitus (strain DJM 731) TaxID=1858805 RepID=M5GF33_DACPD|nr:uncharacterized protein DACRYDRAFT_115111 [Dacryopinax primogenitus]EJU03793.1 hypothetical protein DACRYDRAFT_115111 [Dacryopinax primogenitus]